MIILIQIGFSHFQKPLDLEIEKTPIQLLLKLVLKIMVRN